MVILRERDVLPQGDRALMAETKALCQSGRVDTFEGEGLPQTYTTWTLLAST